MHNLFFCLRRPGRLLGASGVGRMEDAGVQEVREGGRVLYMEDSQGFAFLSIIRVKLPTGVCGRFGDF